MNENILVWVGGIWKMLLMTFAVIYTYDICSDMYSSAVSKLWTTMFAVLMTALKMICQTKLMKWNTHWSLCSTNKRWASLFLCDCESCKILCKKDLWNDWFIIWSWMTCRRIIWINIYFGWIWYTTQAFHYSSGIQFRNEF